MCDGSNHNLKQIYIDHAIDHENVVRWCADCGAIVVDVDYDGRTLPGRVMKMKFPSGKREKKKHPAPHIEAKVKRGEFGKKKPQTDPGDCGDNIW